MSHLTTSRLEALLASFVLGLYLVAGPWFVDRGPPPQPGAGPCEQLCPVALGVTICNMILRLFMRYNAVLEMAQFGWRVAIGQAAFGTIVAGSAIAIALETAHLLVQAEIVVAGCESLLVGILLATRRDATPRLQNGLVHEVWSILTLIWILYVSVWPAWQANPGVIAPMVIGCLTAQHTWYAVQTIMSELTGSQHPPLNLPDNQNSA